MTGIQHSLLSLPNKFQAGTHLKMSNVGQPERATQDRVIALFRDELGYRYLGDWIDRDGNSNIEEDILSAYLTASGYTSAQISAALYKLRTEADTAVG
jgi:type I restriction enzyme, R subunit